MSKHPDKQPRSNAGTLIKSVDRNGNKIYLSQATGRRVILRREAGHYQRRIPSYAFGSFIHPAPSLFDKMLRPL